jgi:hypothetical protein
VAIHITIGYGTGTITTGTSTTGTSSYITVPETATTGGVITFTSTTGGVIKTSLPALIAEDPVRPPAVEQPEPKKMTKFDNYRDVAGYWKEIGTTLRSTDNENKFGALINELSLKFRRIRGTPDGAELESRVKDAINIINLLAKKSNDKSHKRFNQMVRNLRKNFTTVYDPGRSA